MSEKLRCKVTDTKQEILRQYKTHIDDINSKASLVPPSTAEVAKIAKISQALDVAQKIQAHSVEDLAIQLNRSIGESLMGITQKINEQKLNFDQLTTAIQAKKDELRTVHQIEVDANSLAAIIAAQNKSKEETNSEIENILSQAEITSAEIIKTAETRSSEVYLQIKLAQDAEVTRRKRDSEEYNYNFERTKMERVNRTNDELATLSKSLDERIASISLREATINELDAQIVQLKNEILTLKTNQEKAIADAVEKAKKSADTSAAIAANIVKSKHESEVAIKDNELKSANAQIIELRQRIEQANVALTQAQKQVQEVAMSALQAKAEASRPLVVNGSENSSKR